MGGINRNIIIRSILAILLILMTTSCLSPPMEPPVYSRELLRIDERIIKEDVLRFRLRLEMQKFPKGHFDWDPKTRQLSKRLRELMLTVLKKVITDYSVIVYGEKKGIQISEAKLQKAVEDAKRDWNPKSFENFLNERHIPYSRWKQLVEDNSKVQQIMNHELGGKIHVTSNEINDYYRKNRAEFTVPDRIRVRHIVTDSLEKAKDLHNRLMEGENFAKVAIHHSISPDRAKGGDLGYFAEGSFPKEFDDVCFKLKKGEISPVVKSPYGYHIFKLLDKKPAGRKTLEEVAGQIQQEIYNDKVKALYGDWIDLVKADVKVTINHEVLNSFSL